jgi:hypothetical protein
MRRETETQLLYGKSPIPVTAQVTPDSRPLKIYSLHRRGKQVDVMLYSVLLPEFPRRRSVACFDGRMAVIKAAVWKYLESKRVL